MKHAAKRAPSACLGVDCSCEQCHGHHLAVAAKDIEAGTVLGVCGGEALMDGAGDRKGVQNGDVQAEDGNFSMQWPPDEDEVLYISTAKCRNELYYINDYRDHGGGGSAVAMAAAGGANTLHAEVVVEGTPYIIFYATVGVNKGEELTTDYGAEFWAQVTREKEIARVATNRTR